MATVIADQRHGVAMHIAQAIAVDLPPRIATVTKTSRATRMLLARIHRPRILVIAIIELVIVAPVIIDQQQPIGGVVVDPMRLPGVTQAQEAGRTKTNGVIAAHQ